MLRLLFFMNFSGIIFFLLCAILFPYKKDFLPSKYRILIHRLNMMFFIIPFPLFLPYMRKFINDISIKIPFDPSLKNGSHITIRFIDDVYLMLPKPNLILIIVLLIWFFSSIYLFMKNTRDQHNFKKFQRTFDLFMEEKLINGSINATELVKSAMQELNVNRKIKVYTLERLCVPHISGIFHLKLFLPANWNITEQVYYLVIKHEIAHIRHNDLPFQFLSLIACSINGINPVVHVLKSRIEHHEELYADACACTDSTKPNRIAFANAIIDLTTPCYKNPDIPLKGLGFKNDKRLLEERVFHIVKNEYDRSSPIKLAYVGILSFIIFILSALPAVSYNLPAALASDDDAIKFESIDTFDINTLSTENMMDPLSESEPLSVDDFYTLLNSLDFSNNNTYCVDKNGTVSFVNTLKHVDCKHHFTEVYVSHHNKGSDGSCTVVIHKARKCTKCKDIEIIENYTTTKFSICPH